MVLENIYDLGFLALTGTIFLHLLKRFSSSRKPEIVDIPQGFRTNTGRQNSLGETIYDWTQYSGNQRKKIYYEKLIIFYLTYLIPLYITFLTFISFLLGFIFLYAFNLTLILLISSLVSTVLMEITIKIWDIGAI